MIDEDLVNELHAEIERRNRDRHLNDIRHLISTAQGRRYIWGVISICGPMSASMSANMYDTAFREGQRNIGLTMMADIMEAKPEAYDQMRREAASNAKAEEKEIERRLIENE